LAGVEEDPWVVRIRKKGKGGGKVENKEVGLVKTQDLCRMFSVSRQAIYRWRKNGCPSVINSGRFIRYDLDKVISWLKQR
tara:strand:- start:371 stop:610 length:240 start_codon:yes stop_codon:yes gene_type:complete